MHEASEEKWEVNVVTYTIFPYIFSTCQGKQFALNIITRDTKCNEYRTHCIALFYQKNTANHPNLQGKDH